MYFTGLQAARGIAALLVVIFHAPLVLQLVPRATIPIIPVIGSYGAFGVELFFVISGFIIYEVLGRPNFGAAPFLVKRFFRLWPPYLAATLCFVALASIGQKAGAYPALDFSFSNLFRSLAFWPQETKPVLLPGWSLEHEVLYYLAGAIITAALNRTAFFYYMLINSVVGLLTFEVAGLKLWDYHLISTLNGYFLIGAAISRYRTILARIGFAAPMALGTVMFLGSGSLLPVVGRSALVLVGIGAGLMVAAMINIDTDTSSAAKAVRSSKAFSYLKNVGDWSYSLYIFHFSLIPVLSVAFLQLGKPAAAMIPLQILFVLTSIALAAVTYITIERPSDKYGAKASKKLAKRTISAAAPVPEQSTG